MLVYGILFAIFLGLVVGLIAIATRKDRYVEMTEEEFQKEAERSTMLGASVLGLHKVLQPKRVEYILQRDKHAEAEETESGDRPPQDSKTPATSPPLRPRNN